MTPQDVVSSKTKIEQIASLIMVAQRHLADDKIVDLSALEGMVKDLVAAISQTPPDQAIILAGPLQDMLHELGTLEKSLRDHQARTMGRSETATNSLRAISAYGGKK